MATFLGYVEDDFELEEVAEVFDRVQVNAGPPGQEQGAMFADPPDGAVGQGQRFPQRVRGRRRRSDVERFFGTVLVRTLIENQFALTVGKRTQLQAPGVTGEKGIVLEDFGRTLIRDGGGRPDQVNDPGNPGLYLYVSRHGVTTSVPVAVTVATRNGPGKHRGRGVSGDCVTV